MKESILEVLMYLFEHHLEENYRMQLDPDKLVDDLKHAGFGSEEIHSLFEWLQGLAQHAALRQTFQPGNVGSTFRVLATEERNKIGLEVWGFLMFLEQAGIIDATCREVVIANLMELDEEQIDLQQVKSIIMMAMLHQAGPKNTLLPVIEKLLLAGNLGISH